jgi:hypothetical protein
LYRVDAIGVPFIVIVLGVVTELKYFISGYPALEAVGVPFARAREITSRETIGDP